MEIVLSERILLLALGKSPDQVHGQPDRQNDHGAQEEIARRTAEGEFGQPPNTDLRDRAWMEIFEQELSRLSRVIRCGDRVFSGSTAHALHEHPINKDLIAHFKSKGDSVSWGIAESIEKYEEDTKKKVSRGTDIASLYDQETERELAKEVENRIEEALSDGVWKSCIAAAEGGHENGDGADVPRGHVARVPVWWLDGALCQDLLFKENPNNPDECILPEAFSDEVFKEILFYQELY